MLEMLPTLHFPFLYKIVNFFVNSIMFLLLMGDAVLSDWIIQNDEFERMSNEASQSLRLQPSRM
jgi:hypothetical protein